MVDLQSAHDARNIAVDRVGVRGLRYPVKVRMETGGYQETIAEIAVFVDLHPNYRGTHMSRFVEVVDQFAEEELTIFTIPKMLHEIRERLGSHTAEIEMIFPYFLRKAAPVSGRTGMVDYRCHFYGRLDGTLDFRYGVTTYVTTLCPCSKEISEHGAHNQRSEVTVSLRSTDETIVWFEEIIRWVEAVASSPIYSILKREDEKFVTEQAYSHPVFVEDVVRALAEMLTQEERVNWFRIASENMESIHTHNAYAMIERTK